MSQSVPVADLMSDVSAFAPATARQVISDVASFLQHSLVFVVRADPKPVKRTFVHPTEGTPAASDADGPVGTLAFKAEGRMARVFRPQAISFSGLGSNFRRSEWYARQNLLVAEDFIERLGSSGLDVFHRFLPERIELSRFCVGLNLAIPSVVEIHVGQTLEKLRFLSLGQLLNRFDDFIDRAHNRNLA